MRAFRLFFLALALSGAALAQKSERGSIPPGQSRDGAAPAAGAIKGGTILPGETAGEPDRAKLEKRCDELSGTLREECLDRERAASGGAPEPTDTRRQLPAPADSAAGSSSSPR